MMPFTADDSKAKCANSGVKDGFCCSGDDIYTDDSNDGTSYAPHTGLGKDEIKESLKDIETRKRKRLLVSESGDSLWEIVTKTYFRTGYKRVLVGPMYRDIKKKKDDFIDIGDRALKNDKSGVLNLKQKGLK